MLGEIIGVILVGLVAGAIGKLLHPGKDPGGCLGTILIGVAGSALGYLLFTVVFGIGDDDAFDFGGIIGAVIGVIILLMIYTRIVRDRAEARGEPPPRRGRRR